MGNFLTMNTHFYFRKLTLLLNELTIFQLVPAEIPCYSGRVGTEDVEGRDAVYRIMADHSRAVAIAISEGLKVNHRNYWYV